MSTFTSDFAAKRLNLRKQYLNSATADVFFVCGPDDQKERVPAHKFVLYTNSDVFNRMFYGSLPEKDEITIADASPNGFKTFLRYFYFYFDYKLNIDVVGEAMYLAKKYNVNDYFEACCVFLKKNPGTQTAKHMLIGFELAIAHELKDLTDFFKINIIKENEKVFGSEYIRCISLDLLKCILQFIPLLNHSAKRVFDACMGWAEESCINLKIDAGVLQNRRKQLGDCFELIQFGAMERSEIVRCVMAFGDLFTPKELRRFIIIIAAKCPTPVNEDEIIRYKIGKRTMFNTELQADSTEELHFIPRTIIVLGGIAIVHLLHKGRCNILRVIGTLRVLKVSADKEKSDDIILAQEIFQIESTKSSNTDSAPSKVLMFTEPIIVEPHSHYSIQLTFDFTEIGSPYHRHTTSVVDEYPFHILPETNSKVISELLYSRLDLIH